MLENEGVAIATVGRDDDRHAIFGSRSDRRSSRCLSNPVYEPCAIGVPTTSRSALSILSSTASSLGVAPVRERVKASSGARSATSTRSIAAGKGATACLTTNSTRARVRDGVVNPPEMPTIFISDAPPDRIGKCCNRNGAPLWHG